MRYRITMHLFRAMQVKKLLLLGLLTIFTLVIILVITRHTPIDDLDRKYRLERIDDLIRSQASNIACQQPNLPVYSPEMMKFVHEAAKIDCSRSGIDWVKCEGSDCHIQDEVKRTFGPIKCSFTDVIRMNDFDLSEGETTHSDSYYKLEVSDVVKVACQSETSKWSATLTGIRMDSDIYESVSWDNVPNTGLKMNVLMFGFDSISRNSFIRKLPKSYDYMTKVLETDVLKGYNIVGDGTPQALIPILTGKTELELPDTRKRLKNTKFVNAYPFVWNDYKKAGYATAFFEDVPKLGTFTYRLNGFGETPTDHYMRPWYLATLGEIPKWPKYCTGDIPRHQIMFNQLKNFFLVYKEKPKFVFGFHGELSHDDYNLVGAADEDFYLFLKDLKESGYLENTILIVMADHGHRFAEIRNTVQGKQEERLPFFSFTFPQTFRRHFRVAYDNFRHNLDKLSTPFDIHATLRAILNLDNIGVGSIRNRSISLFSRIPAERSCAHAYIEPHWCACLDWHSVSMSSPIVNRLAEKLVQTLNDFTLHHRDLCALLRVTQIEWVTKMEPNQDLLKFYKNADVDGFVADLSAKMEIKMDTYQIKVVLQPGDSIFEASITHSIEDDKLQLKMTDVSRINMYGKQARCVENEFPHLRKYCYCKD